MHTWPIPIPPIFHCLWSKAIQTPTDGSDELIADSERPALSVEITLAFGCRPYCTVSLPFFIPSHLLQFPRRIQFESRVKRVSEVIIISSRVTWWRVDEGRNCLWKNFKEKKYAIIPRTSLIYTNMPEIMYVWMVEYLKITKLERKIKSYNILVSTG